MVARAILHKPQILFLDEPTAGLDPQSRIALWEIVQELHGEGQTVMLTTHYMEEADLLADRVAIMDHGSILALDTPDALKRSIGAESIVRVSADGDLQHLADAPLRQRGRRHPGDRDRRRRRPARQRARPAPAGHRRRRPGRHRRSPTSRSASRRLETVFINLTGKDLRE